MRGCTLAEAAWRTLGHRRDSEAAPVDAAFREFFVNKQLIALGRPGDKSASVHWIASKFWETIAALDLATSSICQDPATSIYDVHVFPLLLSPVRVQLLTGLGLGEIFRKYILNDPEVAWLGHQAIQKNPIYERVFIDGACWPQGMSQWPIQYEGRQIDGLREMSAVGALAAPEPPIVIEARCALSCRFATLMDLLRSGDMAGVGVSASGEFVELMRSIWSHPQYRLSADGDIFESNPEAEGFSDLLTKRWSAVVLRQSSKQDGHQSWYPQYGADNAKISIQEITQFSSLAEALRKLVLDYPGHATLRARARALGRADFSGWGPYIGPGLGHDIELLPFRYLRSVVATSKLSDTPVEEDPEIAKYFEHADDDISRFYDAQTRRLIDFFENFLVGRATAWGHTRDGLLVQIAVPIWSHEEFYLDPATGDLYEAAEEGMVKRWTALVVSRPFDPQPPGYDQIRPAAVLTTEPVFPKGPRSDETRRALAKAGINLATFVGSNKSIRELIRPFLTQPLETGRQVEALDRNISRLRKQAESYRFRTS